MVEPHNLSYYCFHGSPAGVQFELRNGADPNGADENGVTPLMWLGEMFDQRHLRERKRIFRYLLKAGASLILKDSRGLTALDYAKYGAARGFRSFIRREYQRLNALPKPNKNQ